MFIYKNNIIEAFYKFLPLCFIFWLVEVVCEPSVDVYNVEVELEVEEDKDTVGIISWINISSTKIGICDEVINEGGIRGVVDDGTDKGFSFHVVIIPIKYRYKR